MTDKFLESLRSEWHYSDAMVGDMASNLAAYRRRVRLTMIAAYVGSAVVLACLLFLGWLAISQRDMLVAVAVIAFVSAMPVVVHSLITLRRDFVVAQDESPFVLLLQMRKWSTTMFRSLSSARWCAGILLVSAALAWALFFVQAAPLRAVVMLSAAWIATAVVVWFWQEWRGRRLADDIARMDQTIAQFRAADRDAD